MKLKINSFIVFLFLFCVNGFSQDPVKTQKVIYKIPVETPKAGTPCKEKVVLADDKNSIHSCEINASKKEATVTTKTADGSLSKEKFIIKENK